MEINFHYHLNLLRVVMPTLVTNISSFFFDLPSSTVFLLHFSFHVQFMFLQFTGVFFELHTSYGGFKGNWDVLGTSLSYTLALGNWGLGTGELGS